MPTKDLLGGSYILHQQGVEDVKVVSQEDIRKWDVSQGVSARVLLSGDKILLLLVEVKPGGEIHEHSHPHEQKGLCLQGKARFDGGGESSVVEAGMAYFFPSKEKHSAKIIGDRPAVFLEILSPPREDHIKKQKIADNSAEGTMWRQRPIDRTDRKRRRHGCFSSLLK